MKKRKPAASQRPVGFTYDVAFSFAGEDRPYVAKVAEVLAAAGVKVFYDEYETVTLWGKDLYVHLRDVYQNQARYTVLFASAHYAAKVWTNHERQSAQARAIAERSEYILPARFDEAEIPGLLETTGYIDLQRTTPQQLAALILAKLGHKPGSWEGPPAILLPGQEQSNEESLRVRAARLAATAHAREQRELLLNSQRGVDLARAEVAFMYDYMETEINAFVAQDPNLTIHIVKNHEEVTLVRSGRASFTMHWGQTFSNSLRNARIFAREFDGPHSLDSFGPRGKAIREAYIRFDVDEALRPGWREDTSGSIFLTTRQLADKYLSRVIERIYSPADTSIDDLDED
jgi:hypothetical protein